MRWSTARLSCATCPPRPEIRRALGCRLLDPTATANPPATVLDGTPLETTGEYCMALDAASPAVARAWELHGARECGYSLGSYSAALAPEADLVTELAAALRAAAAMEHSD